MRRSATVLREGTRASATGIAPAQRKTTSSNRKASSQAFSAHSPFDSAGVKALASNELLFSLGDPKTHFYAVKSGALAIYEPRWNGHRAIIEFAFPGDLVGLGFLQTHTCSARATVETSVQCLPLSAQDHLFADDPRAQARLADAIEREVEFLREFFSSIQSTKSARATRCLLADALARERAGGSRSNFADAAPRLWGGGRLSRTQH